jgi:hypothetical protein
MGVRINIPRFTETDAWVWAVRGRTVSGAGAGSGECVREAKGSRRETVGVRNTRLGTDGRDAAEAYRVLRRTHMETSSPGKGAQRSPSIVRFVFLFLWTALPVDLDVPPVAHASHVAWHDIFSSPLRPVLHRVA